MSNGNIGGSIGGILGAGLMLYAGLAITDLLSKQISNKKGSKNFSDIEKEVFQWQKRKVHY